MQDFFLEQDNFSIFDLVIDAQNKIFEPTEGLDTAINFQLFVDRRVTQQERANSRNRRGWVGDMATRDENFQVGSLLHLQEQSRNTIVENNETAAYAKDSLEYLVRLGASKEITARVVGSNIEGTIVNSANDTSRYSRLWKAQSESFK